MDLRISDSRQFCPVCAKCLENSAFDSGVAFCRTCQTNRDFVRFARLFSLDKRFELTSKLISVLAKGQTPDRAIGTRGKRSVRDLVISLAAEDRNFRDAILSDLQMLVAKQASIPRISAAQNVEDVRNRKSVNI